MVPVVTGLIPVDRIAGFCAVHRLGGLRVVGGLCRLVRLTVLRGLGPVCLVPAVGTVLPGGHVVPLRPRTDVSAAGDGQGQGSNAARRVPVAITRRQPLRAVLPLRAARRRRAARATAGRWWRRRRAGLAASPSGGSRSGDGTCTAGPGWAGRLARRRIGERCGAPRIRSLAGRTRERHMPDDGWSPRGAGGRECSR